MHDIRIDKLDIGNQTHSAQIDVQTRQISTMVTEAQTHGTKIDEHGLQIDENTSQLTRLNTAVNRHNIQTAEHARNLTTLDLEVKKQGEEIDGHSTKIDQYDRNISRLDTEVRGLVMQLEDQGKNIEKKRKELTTLGIRSQDHDAQIDEHALQIATLDKGIQRHDRQIDEFSRKLTTLNSGVHEHRRHMENHSRQLVVLSSQYQSQKKEILEIKENVQSVKRTSATDVQRLKKRLEKINNDVTKVITLSPLQDRGENELPIELLYAQVVILEDNKYGEKSSLHYRKEVTHPSDVFMKNSEDIRRIYMLGDAAHGKTTYCLWLVKNWCNAQLTDRGHRDEWEKALQEFAFVFLLQFRKVNPRRDCVVDMICKDVFGDAEDCWDSIRYVLTSSKYKSLIIMDGLDEWNPNDETRKQLTYQGMPNIHVSSTVSCFFSMRPWVFSMITNLIKISDKVIEIQGLSLSGMEKVVENVLLNRYKLKDDIGKYLHTKKKIVNHLNEKNLISFMQIPLLAVICVQIWFEGIQVGDSMTSFYAVMINMLIERANEKYELQKYHDELIDSKLPEIFSKLGNVKRHSSALLRLGKVAHEGLLSSKINLVFQKRKLQIEIGVGELQFALDVGLISQMEAPSLLTKNVSVHFFHKSIQEFLAAFYIVSNKEVGDAFCKHLSTAKVIMELSNVIMFICGMCPSLGSAISQQVAYLIYSDMEICKYRESPYGGNSTLREIYKLQLSWYRDLQYGQTDREMTFHISDVYLSDVSDVETLRATRGLLFDDRVDIRSLYLQWIPTDNEHGITDSDLNYFLSNSHSTRSLVMVYVNGKDTDRSIHTICGPKLKTLYLVNVKMIDMLSVGRGCSPLLLDVTSLCELWLYGVQVGDRELGLSPDMVHLQKVDLAYVKMSTKCWQQFILSLQNVKHKFVAELYATNIDEVTKKNIRSSSDFNVTLDRLNEVTRLYELDFTRVWPLSQ